MSVVHFKQWDGQVGNGLFFPTWTSLSQWGIKKNSLKNVANIRTIIFQTNFFYITKFNQHMPRQLKTRGVNLWVFLNPSTNPSKNPRFFFFKTPQVNLTCISWCWIFPPVLALTGLKTPSSNRWVFKKPVLISTGFKNPSPNRRVL